MTTELANQLGLNATASAPLAPGPWSATNLPYGEEQIWGPGRLPPPQIFGMGPVRGYAKPTIPNPALLPELRNWQIPSGENMTARDVLLAQQLISYGPDFGRVGATWEKGGTPTKFRYGSRQQLADMVGPGRADEFARRRLTLGMMALGFKDNNEYIQGLPGGGYEIRKAPPPLMPPGKSWSDAQKAALRQQWEARRS